MQIVIDIPEEIVKRKDFVNYFGCYSATLDEVLMNGKILSTKYMTKDDFIYALKTCEYTVYNGQVMYAEEDLIKRFKDIGEI